MKQKARSTVLETEDRLVALSRSIHAHPETAFEEERASGWLCDVLSDLGLAVKTPHCELPTAFEATAGSGPLSIAVCAEYDALPVIGHACGHNVIAAAAVGAAAALAPIADDLGITLKIIGTPAEEGGGGKVIMLERGAFEGAHAAMMVHPAPSDDIEMETLAVSHFAVDYVGKAAHASAYPERGINAADAMTLAQVAIGLLRQQLEPGDQVHGVVTNGGEAPNTIPAHTSARYYARTRTMDQLEVLTGRVRACFQAGAVATGAELLIRPTSPEYSEFVTDTALAGLYRRNAESLGRSFPIDPSVRSLRGSTDMGNVSKVVPSIHPLIGIESGTATNHQPDFAAASGGPGADRAIIDGALAMAWTAIDISTSPLMRSRLEGSGGAERDAHVSNRVDSIRP